MKIARSVEQAGARPRAVAIGTFDGVHLGHQRVIRAALDSDLEPTVVTFDPHPRTALGNQVELISTLERRLELIAALGVSETIVIEFTLDLAADEPEEFAETVLRAIGTRIVVAGTTFRFGRRRAGDLGLLEGLGFETRPVPLVEGVSSTAVRGLVRAGEVDSAARLLGRAAELEGTVVVGDSRGGTLGYPTANLALPAELVVPAFGIYAGTARGHRAAISIGTNPHYGGTERRVEAFLLDFQGDLYGQSLRVELWRRLRDERSFASEAELVVQIERDVQATRSVEPPL